MAQAHGCVDPLPDRQGWRQGDQAREPGGFTQLERADPWLK
ncbi:hypothetical protein [Sphingobium sp.]